MYIRTHFREDDEASVEAFMRQFDFAAIVTHSTEGLVASHIPVTIRRSEAGLQVVGHVARANAHWRLMDGQAESMVIFQGPHGYISPTWYVEPRAAVPTWNYAVVHAYGRPHVREDAAFIKDVVEELARRYEGHREHPWSPDLLQAQSYEKLVGAIVGFEMPILRWEAQFKLGQNRSAQDRERAAAALEGEGPAAADLAGFMRRHAR